MNPQDKVILFVLFVILITAVVTLLINKKGFLDEEDEMVNSKNRSFLKFNPLTSFIKAGDYIISGGNSSSDDKNKKNVNAVLIDDFKGNSTAKITMQHDINPCLHAFFNMKIAKLRAADPEIDKKTLLIFHYADWCPYCIEMKGPWNEIKFKYLKNDKFRFEEQNEEQCKTIGINIVPVIFKIKDRHVCKYRGPKTVKDLEEWMNAAII